jgi:hypothetical protein
MKHIFLCLIHFSISHNCFFNKTNSVNIPELLLYDLICLLTAFGLTPGGSSTVQYTFTHKQFTEQHNETEYLERNIRNNKNT